jgi:O-methyltransferase involved in polyketide biosynthesis
MSQHSENSLRWIGHELENTMMAKISVNELHDVAETLLIPLYARAQDSQQFPSILNDTKAQEMVNRLDYDFSGLKSQKTTNQGVLLRAREIDRHVRAFLETCPDGIIVEIGCGLDTRFNRLDNGSAQWFHLDFPQVIALRRQFFDETPTCRFLSYSVLDRTWLDAIKPVSGQRVLFVAEAVFPYIAGSDVKDLFLTLKARFPGSEIIFDSIPPLLTRLSRVHPALRKIRAQIQIRWGMGRSRALEAWGSGIRLLGEYRYMDGSSMFAGWGILLRLFSFFWNGFRVIQYRLGEPGV